MAERNAGVHTDNRIEFRIGINVGDVVVEDGDIFGDGVNVAARLEGSGRTRAASASRPVSRKMLPGGSISPSRIWASRASKTSPDPFAYIEFSLATTETAEKPRRPKAPRACPARQAFDRGAAVPEHERRPGAGILRRRHGRGNHHRAQPHPMAVRDRPEFNLHLQGASRRCEASRARAWRPVCARRLGAQGRHGSALPGS